MLDRIIAVDWSGNKQPSAQRKHIWIADWHNGQVTLSCDRTRQQTIDFLIAALKESPRLVVGLDFAFSYPEWFVQENGCQSAVSMWRLVKESGPTWLSECKPPFWGLPKTTRPKRHGRPEWLGFRKTESEVRNRRKQHPKSPFQIGGAGAVGTGSIRGMPFLIDLQAAGFAIWPFDPTGLPIVIEIYPRLSVGDRRVGERSARTLHLQDQRFRKLTPSVQEAAYGSADAFDSLCALFDMVAYREDLTCLQQTSDPTEMLEGRIWIPDKL